MSWLVIHNITTNLRIIIITARHIFAGQTSLDDFLSDLWFVLDELLGLDQIFET
jgi:hypothetical protein